MNTNPNNCLFPCLLLTSLTVFFHLPKNYGCLLGLQHFQHENNVGWLVISDLSPFTMINQITCQEILTKAWFQTQKETSIDAIVFLFIFKIPFFLGFF